MKNSPDMNHLAAALAAAQAEFPVIPKERSAEIEMRNGGTYSYLYADMGDIIDALRPHLAANGLSVVQGVGTKGPDNVVTTRLLHSSGQWVEDTMRLPGLRDATPQSFGSAITYAKRYAYGALLNVVIDDGDDDGALAELAWGDTGRATRRRAPASSTPAKKAGGATKKAASRARPPGPAMMASTDRNKVTRALAAMEPKIVGDAVAAYVGQKLERDGPVQMATLSEEEGISLMRRIGIPVAEPTGEGS